MFTTAVSNQQGMTIKVLQGEREMARDNWKLGEFAIEFEPAPKGVPRVGVQFEIDVNGILHVLARDTATGREKSVEMSSAVDVSDEAVEAMLADSLEHAFADVNERIWTETKLKSEEMLGAVTSALRLIGEEMEETEKMRVAALADAVRLALSSGELRKLKQANDELDAAPGLPGPGGERAALAEGWGEAAGTVGEGAIFDNVSSSSFFSSTKTDPCCAASMYSRAASVCASSNRSTAV
jgi:molecular chaperone DnaK